MDTNRLSKMNELSKELQKHGFATSSIDASEQAQGIMKEYFTESKKGENNSALADSIMQMMKSISSLKSFKSQSEEKIVQLEANFKLVLGKVNEIVAEINGLKSSTQLAAHEKSEKQAQLPKPEKKSNNSCNPRQGTYAPEDVAIEKIFYYGQK